MTNETTKAPETSPLARSVASVAGTLSHPEFPKGDLAALRRGGAALVASPGFWRVLLDRVDESQRATDQAERTWAVIFQAMAIMAPDIHSPGRTLGAVLAGMSESLEHRFLRLLRSRGEQLEDQVRLMARLLASHGAAVDWVSLAELLLAERDEVRERVVRRLARDYYGKKPSAA